MAGRLALVGRPRGPLLVAAVTSVATVGFLWWPRDDYRPIQPGERGTLVGGVRSLTDIASGRASLTPQRLRELGGAPTERQRARTRAPGGSSSTPTSTSEDGSVIVTTGTGTATTESPGTGTGTATGTPTGAGTATTTTPPASGPMEPWASPSTSRSGDGVVVAGAAAAAVVVDERTAGHDDAARHDDHRHHAHHDGDDAALREHDMLDELSRTQKPIALRQHQGTQMRQQ